MDNDCFDCYNNVTTSWLGRNLFICVWYWRRGIFLRRATARVAPTVATRRKKGKEWAEDIQHLQGKIRRQRGKE
jgi:hypothetical protein